MTISGDTHSLLVTKLVENVKYVFSVRARTKIAWGEAVNGSTTTGPQTGLYYSTPNRALCPYGYRNVHDMTSGRFVPQIYRQIHALSNVAFFH